MRVLPFIAVASALMGCWDVNSERCGDVLCPLDTECFAADGVCVPPDQLCDQADDTPCLFGDRQESDGLCIAGLCRPFQCQAPIIAGREPTLDRGEECEIGFVASCLDFGFDRGTVGCDEGCQNDLTACGGIGWDSQSRGGGYSVRGIAETPGFTLAFGTLLGASPVLRRAAGDDLFEFVDVTAIPEFGGITDLGSHGDQVVATGLDFAAFYDGSDWTVETENLGLGTTWRGVAAASGIVRMVGTDTFVARRAAGEWVVEQIITSDNSRAFQDLWLEDEDNGVAVGDGIIARLAGGIWSEIVLTPPRNLLAVAAASPQDVYIAGVDAFARLDGDAVTVIPTPTPFTVFSLEADGEEVFIGTGSGALWRYDGASFFDISPVTELVGAIRATTTGLMAGTDQSLHDHRGMAWARHQAPPTDTLHQVFATGSGDMLIARSRGSFGDPKPAMRFDGIRFSDAGTGANDLTLAWGRAGQRFAAKGATLYELVVNQWIEVETLDAALGAIAGDEDRLFVVGDAGLLVDIDTGAINAGTTVNLHGAHTATGLPLFVVGDAGFFARVESGVTTAIETGVDVSLRDVFAAGADDVYLVGDDNTLLHYDGDTVVPMAAPLLAGAPLIVESLVGVHGTSATDIFAVGDEGLILHFDGASWTLVRSPAGALSDVFALPTVVTFVGPSSEFHQLVRPAP